MHWLSARIDMYVLWTYHAKNPVVHRAPPALCAQGAARRRAAVSPDAIWHLIEKANEARTNIEQAIDLKSDEAAFIV